MNKNNLFGIGIVFAMLLVFTAPAAAADNTVYFDPDPSCAAPGEEITVTLWLNSSSNCNSWNHDLYFDPNVVDIIDGQPGDFPTMFGFTNWGHFVRVGGISPDWGDYPPGQYILATYTMKANSSGTGIGTFHHTANALGDEYGHDLPNQVWVDGTFNNPCPVPYNISGCTFDNDGYPENDATVKVINLNSSEKWDATTSPADNSYELTLYNVNAGEILRLIAKDGVEWINVTDRPVTQAKIDAGGVSNVNLTLDEFYLDLKEFPMYEAEEPDYNEYCGPAVAKMWLDYMHNSTTQWNDTQFGDMPAMNQDELYTWGIGNNSNTSLPYFDTRGMWYTVQYLDPGYSEYGYNFGTYSSTDKDYMLKQICRWIAYAPGKKPGHPVHVPAAVPAYGSYENWMAIRGIHTDEDAYPIPPTLEVYGFWANDPYPASMGGIGENSYKTADEWTDTYYLPLVTDDTYNGKYVAILEPPEGTGGEITVVSSPARFSAEAAQTVLAARAIQAQTQTVTGVGVKGVKGTIAGMETMAEVGDVVVEADRWIVQAAIDGANEQLAPYDPEFAAVFEDVVADNPLLVENGDNDYYLVPFAESCKDSVEEVDAMIADLEAMKNAVPAAHEAAIQASIDELTSLRSDLNLDRGEILVVIIIDADDGHFKEASWVTTPVVYLPTTEDEALGIVGISGATAELVYMDESPYYPDWKITDGCSVYYVNQQGELFDADADCDGYLISEGDCNDNNAAANPGATEVCDGVDNDCDGEVDEGCPTDPSVIDYRSDAEYYEWCIGWGNVDNALVRDGACAVAVAPGEASITLDMGETKNSGTIAVRCGSCFGEGANFDGTTTVYGSADNSNWVTLGTFVIPEDSDLTDYAVPFSDQQVRYVKVHLLITECETEWSVDGITW